MKDKQVIVSDEVFMMTEREIEAMLEGLTNESEENSNRRVESIMKRARLETVLKESTDVMAEGITSGLKGIAGAMSGLVKKDSDPPRRSY